MVTRFQIFNASAGSGKTYALVKAYLKCIIASTKKEPFKHVLAITFTNKAVGEMKQRILEMLQLFASKSILKTHNSMFISICNDLNKDAIKVHQISKKLLDRILCNYSAFEVLTIDGFTHKLIQTFALDLKLPLNFEVEIDQNEILNQAIDNLIYKAGTKKTLTKLLVNFAIEKIVDDKSWDIALDFNKIAKLLVNENDMPFIESLKEKTVHDFKTLKKTFQEKNTKTEDDIVNLATQTISLIKDKGLAFTDFSRSTLPNHFLKASRLQLDNLYNNKLEEQIKEKINIYNKTLGEDLKNTIDALLPTIETNYLKIKTHVFKLRFNKAVIKNLIPISVLNAIQPEVKAILEEDSKVLISEFNTIISNEIKNQPTPFIYERIGEKYKHFFIDEFQDTSVMQWNNLIPLISNALHQQDVQEQSGTLMLVGDAKQAIYRWRGGKAEQFINLTNNVNPFLVSKHIKHLPTNYRSFSAIVNFNNLFFNYLSTSALSNETHKQLFSNADQKPYLKQTGYVSLSFLEVSNAESRAVEYPKKVLETIEDCINSGFNLDEICILVRYKREGVAIGQFLNQNGLTIISSETLLLKNAPEIRYINAVLKLLIEPQNNEVKLEILSFLVSKYNVEDSHAFFKSSLVLDDDAFFNALKVYHISLNPSTLITLPFYSIVETIIRESNLIKDSNAYIQTYLDVVLDYTRTHVSNIIGFIDYFENKKEVLSVSTNTLGNAINIMTIHKAKGLEFPVVIFPYADLNIYREKEPKTWFSINPETHNGFSNVLLNYNKDIEHFGKQGQQLYNEHQYQLELDQINLLYVALTRAVQQLYIISKKDINSKNIVNPKTYSGFFINYLKHIGLWKNEQLTYTFGNSKKIEILNQRETENTLFKPYKSSSYQEYEINIITKSGYLWNTKQQEAIEKGNLIHKILAQIKSKTDIDFALNDFIGSALINIEQAAFIKPVLLRLVNHSALKAYFSTKNQVLNERAIISPNGQILRPDRLVFTSKSEVVIIDYKTGLKNPKHLLQLKKYETVLVSMSIKVIKKILVYINKDISVDVF